jgi:hypothetical protein
MVRVGIFALVKGIRQEGALGVFCAADNGSLRGSDITSVVEPLRSSRRLS